MTLTLRCARDAVATMMTTAYVPPDRFQSVQHRRAASTPSDHRPLNRHRRAIAPAFTVQRHVTTESAGHEDSWTTRTGQPYSSASFFDASSTSSSPSSTSAMVRTKRWQDDNPWYRRQSPFQQLDVTADDVPTSKSSRGQVDSSSNIADSIAVVIAATYSAAHFRLLVP